jgi:hypothetical protein
MRRDELMDDVDGFKDEMTGLKIFKPIVAAWHKFIALCEPISRFHDEYCIYVWNAVLVVGVALAVGYVYLRR